MFRRYRVERGYPIYSNEKNESEIYGCTPTPVIRHTHQQLTVLKDSLLSHRYGHSAEIMRGLVHALNICPDIVRRAGIAVLRQSSDTYSECVQYYKNLLAKKSVKQREVLLLELTLFMVSNGNIQDSVDMLGSYLQSDPFISNKLLQSYAGLFNYILWRRQVNEEKQVVSEGNDQTFIEEVDMMNETDTELTTSLGSGSTPRPGSRGRYVTAALQHWKVVVGDGEEGLLWHPFVREHVEMLEHVGEGKEAYQLMLKIAHQHSDDLWTQKAALQYVKRYHSSDEKVKVALLRTMSSIDPSCKEVTELAEILMNGTEAEVEEGRAILKIYHEYPHNKHHIQ